MGGYVYETTIGVNVGTELVSLDGSLDGSNDGKIEGLFLEDSLVCAVGKVIGYDEGKNLVYTDSKVLGTILVNVM